MGWNRNVYESEANTMSDWSYPPNGGRPKMILLGVILPLIIIYYSYDTWTSETAQWMGRSNSFAKVSGNTAKAIAVCYLSTALFAHFRWFWGLLPNYGVFKWGVVVSLLLGLGSCGYAHYFAFR